MLAIVPKINRVRSRTNVIIPSSLRADSLQEFSAVPICLYTKENIYCTVQNIFNLKK